ncbi:MAG: hypothetical protein ABJL55_17125 [Roseibium sp.]
MKPHSNRIQTVVEKAFEPGHPFQTGITILAINASYGATFDDPERIKPFVARQVEYAFMPDATYQLARYTERLAQEIEKEINADHSGPGQTGDVIDDQVTSRTRRLTDAIKTSVDHEMINDIDGTIAAVREAVQTVANWRQDAPVLSRIPQI